MVVVARSFIFLGIIIDLVSNFLVKFNLVSMFWFVQFSTPII